MTTSSLGTSPARLGIVLSAAILVGGLGASAATAAFNDVPPENQFPEHITAVQESGIATGFPDGSFRPTAPINRQQAAAWIDRASSRGALDFADTASEYAPVSPADPVRQVATIDVTSPVSTGGGWVLLQGLAAAGTRNGTGAGCPCAMNVRVLDSSEHVVAIGVLTVLGPESDDERTGFGPAIVSPLMAMLPFPGGTSESYTLELELVDSDVEQVLISGMLSAQYMPMAEGDPTQNHFGESGPVDLVESLVPTAP